MGGRRLDFEIEDRLETGLLTAHAGVPGLIEAFRQTGAAAVIDREVQIKQRKRGLGASEMVESVLALWAAGGERAEDLDRLRGDEALATLLGHGLPAAQTARDFLAQFHQDALPLLQAGDAPVPGESAPLAGLGKANAALLLDMQARRPVRTATLDVDATIIDSDKRAARRTYEGGRGYQPVLVLWTEQDVIVGDEFHDGNVPAGCGNRRVVEKAIAALPPGIAGICLLRRQRPLRTRLDALAGGEGDRIRDLRRHEPATRRLHRGVARGGLAARPGGSSRRPRVG